MNICRPLSTVNISEMADKAMKSLEEVIKYKLKFLPAGIDPFYAIQTYTAERGPDPPLSSYDIYKTKNRYIFFNDSLGFMEDITPLFIYILSCEKYYHENGHGEICFIEISLFTDFDDDECVFYGRSIIRDSRCPDFNKKEHRIFDIKKKKYEYFYIQGYCNRFLIPSMLLIRGNFNHLQTEEEHTKTRIFRSQSF